MDHGMTMPEAIRFVKQGRSKINPNMGFKKQLYEFEKQVRHNKDSREMINISQSNFYPSNPDQDAKLQILGNSYINQPKPHGIKGTSLNLKKPVPIKT